MGARALRKGPFDQAVASANSAIDAQATSKLSQIIHSMTPDEVMSTYDANVDRHRTPDGRFHDGPVRHGEDPFCNMADDDDGNER